MKTGMIVNVIDDGVPVDETPLELPVMNFSAKQPRDKRGRFASTGGGGGGGGGGGASRKTSQQVMAHPNYSESDHKYLRDKGYSDDEIVKLWDRDRSMGKGSVEHAPIFDIVKYLNQK